MQDTHALVFKGDIRRDLDNDYLLFGTDGENIHDYKYYLTHNHKNYLALKIRGGWEADKDLEQFMNRMKGIKFNAGDKRYFTMFSNEGVICGENDLRRKDMFRYLWKEIFKERMFKGIKDGSGNDIRLEIEDLTEGNYLTRS